MPRLFTRSDKRSYCNMPFFGLPGLGLYVPVNDFPVMSGRFPGLNQYKAMKMKCLVQVHNTTPLARFDHMTLRSRVRHSTN